MAMGPWPTRSQTLSLGDPQCAELSAHLWAHQEDGWEMHIGVVLQRAGGLGANLSPPHIYLNYPQEAQHSRGHADLPWIRLIKPLPCCVFLGGWIVTASLSYYFCSDKWEVEMRLRVPSPAV